MKTTELRRGNLIITDDYSDTVFSVQDIEGETITCKGGKNGTWTNPADLWNPIQLTEDWLITFGFTKSEMDYNPDLKEYVKGNCVVYLYNKVNREIYFGIYDTKIKYVHQLQNIWFAFTNTELKTTTT